MQYPTGTPVHTFTLETTPDEGCLVSPVVVVVRDPDGCIRAVECADYWTAQEACHRYADNGGLVLAVVEGERNLGTGETTVWIQ